LRKKFLQDVVAAARSRTLSESSAQPFRSAREDTRRYIARRQNWLFSFGERLFWPSLSLARCIL